MWLAAHGRRRALAAVLGGAAMFGLWLLLVEDFSPSEVLAGVAAAAIATLAGRRALHGEQRVPRRLAGQARALGRAPFAVVRDGVIVLGTALLAGLRLCRVRSEFREMPFAGSGDGPDAAGRRAIAIAVHSAAPNSIVLGFDTDNGVMVVHQLVPTGTTRSRTRAHR